MPDYEKNFYVNLVIAVDFAMEFFVSNIVLESTNNCKCQEQVNNEVPIEQEGEGLSTYG